MSIFKAYDIRGRYPEQLDEARARDLGSAIAECLQADPIAVGRDVRQSAPAISRALQEGILRTGRNVVDIGCVTTPLLYFAVSRRALGGGVMITASHNPPEYIGMKVCREHAIPLSGDEGLPEVQRLLAERAWKAGASPASASSLDMLPDYRRYLLETLGELPDLLLAVDTANGAVGPVFEAVFQGTGLRTERLFFEPDGRFPNHEPNPLKAENVESLRQEVLRSGATLGAAFDGDGDRCLFIDEKGARVRPDLVTALLAEEVLERRPGAAIVYDLRSSRAVAERIRALGGRPVRERVGHSFLKARMRRENAAFAGELSGHYYFAENDCADDGLFALVQLLRLLRRRQRPFSELMAPLASYHASGELNFEVSDKEGLLKQLKEAFRDGRADQLDGLTVEYDEWWFNVRPSNTEPLVRLNLEANEAATMQSALARVLAIMGEPVCAGTMV